MKEFYFFEKQNLQSTRNPTIIHAETIEQAKRIASKTRVFKDTVLCLSDMNHTLLSYKIGRVWKDTADMNPALARSYKVRMALEDDEQADA